MDRRPDDSKNPNYCKIPNNKERIKIKKPIVKKWNPQNYIARDSYMNFGQDSETYNLMGNFKPPKLYRLENVDQQLEALHHKCYYLECENERKKNLIKKLQSEKLDLERKIKDLNKNNNL